jgi:plasmid stabilization system protein ParE
VTPLFILDDAEAEIVAAGDWYYSSGHAGVAIRFREAIERAFDAVGEAPASFVVVDDWQGVVLRRAMVRGFPYQVVFGELSGQLWIIAVAHLRREPGYWRTRVIGA